MIDYTSLEDSTTINLNDIIKEQDAASSSVEMPVTRWRANDDETKVFKAIDRDAEDKQVFYYQSLRKKREELIDRLYALRKPDIRDWVKKFGYLGQKRHMLENKLKTAWERCLTFAESNPNCDFAFMLSSFLKTEIDALFKNKNRRQTDYPVVKSLEEEKALFQEYRKVVNEISDVLGGLYALREPTLRVWAKRYHYLSTGEDEMLAELRFVWMRCVNDYEYEPKVRVVKTRHGKIVHHSNGKAKKRFKRTSFNTYKFCAFQHFIINQIKKKYHCNKRVDKNGIPFEQTMLSLDQQYDGKDDDKTTLYDVIPGESRDNERSHDAEVLVDLIAGNDDELRYALERLQKDPHIKSLEMACRLRGGVLPICNADRDFIHSRQALNDDSWRERVAQLLISSGRVKPGFSVTDFTRVGQNKIYYEIRVEDNELLLRMNKAIKKANLERQLV